MEIKKETGGIEVETQEERHQRIERECEVEKYCKEIRELLVKHGLVQIITDSGDVVPSPVLEETTQHAYV